MSWPSIRMRPAVGRRTPVMQLKRVDLPAPLGPMTARISPRRTLSDTRSSAVRPPKRTVRSSVRRIAGSPPSTPTTRGPVTPPGVGPLRRGRSPPGPSPPVRRRRAARSAARGPSREPARRREDGLLLGNHLQDAVLAALDRQDELAQERLVVLPSERLVALREVLALLRLEPLEGLDELRGVLASLESRALDPQPERVHRLVVRLHVAVRQRPAGIDLLEPRHRVLEESLVVGGVERALQHRDVPVDADEALDLLPQRREVGRLRDGAVAGPAVLAGEPQVGGLVADRHAVLPEE